jgi:hypothetical protein
MSLVRYTKNVLGCLHCLYSPRYGMRQERERRRHVSRTRCPEKTTQLYASLTCDLQKRVPKSSLRKREYPITAKNALKIAGGLAPAAWKAD